MQSTVFFPPAYFNQSYFYPFDLNQTTQAAAPQVGTFDELTIYNSILEGLKGTSLFPSVLFASPADRLAAKSSPTPAVELAPLGWEDVDDVDPVSVVRKLKFQIRLVVRARNAIDRFQKSSYLETVVRSLINGSSLGGVSLPALSRVLSAKYETSSPPEQATTLDCECFYIPDGR
jgi:hypothetical protein